MHQIFYRLGLHPDLTGGTYSAHPDSLIGIGQDRGGAPEEREGGREGEGSGGKGREGEGRGGSPGMPKCRVGKPRAGG